MKLHYILFLLLPLLSTEVRAQDPIFTQFFLVPETLNPAVTGLANTWNAGLIHRRQWPDGTRKIDTQYGFANNMVNDEIGLGATFLNHHEEFTNYNYSQFNGAFSYALELDNDWQIRFGLEAGYGRKNYNFKNLLLEDQINFNDETISSGSVDPGVLNYSDTIDFFDVSAGFLVVSENAWFGTALKHLNRPDISFTEYANVPLDLFLTVHGGYYIAFEGSPLLYSLGDPTLLLTANYMRQSQYNRLDLGGVLEFNRFSFGVIAATNPEGKSSNSSILTSVSPVFSLKLNEFTFGYSYDANTTKFGNSQGVHELSLTWQSSRRCDKCDNYKVKLKRNGVNVYQ
ncbi:PorP/SprF family type IX secretion system membrane protein [Flavobacterium myungsuense]|uniref:PorP/SprF family type IX secretion system membrane protein n=1 Tax=Flavobacterium myungsuense TaxID=651823 RepID=A0ABW3J2G0_9FLAO